MAENYNGNLDVLEVIGKSKQFKDFGGQHHHEPFFMISGDGMDIYEYVDARGNRQNGMPNKDPDWGHWDETFLAKTESKKTGRPVFVANSVNGDGVHCTPGTGVTVKIALPSGVIIFSVLGRLE